MTEEQLLLRIVSDGDRDAFETLVSQHQAAAVQFAEGLLHDRFAAEEAVQDAFAEFYFRRERFRGECAFKTYLYAILRHKCIDRLRRRQCSGEPLDADTPAPSFEEACDLRESCEEAFLLMRSLPGRQLDTLWQYAVQGLSYREIAAQSGRSEVQIRAEVFRARKTMRRMRRELYGS